MAFIFNAGKGETPESLARKRQIAEALAGNSRAPKNIGEGLTAIGEALGYRGMMRDITKGEQAGQEQGNKAFAPIAALLGGGGGGSPVAAPQASVAPMDPASQRVAQAHGGGSEIEAYIRQAAQQRGIDPEVAIKVAMSEGGVSDPFQQSNIVKDGQREPSYGPFQLYMGGGMGNDALAAGIDPRKDWQGGVNFALDQAKEKGWQPWYGAQKIGITGMQGIGAPAQGGAPQQMAQAGGGGQNETIQILLQAAQDPWLNENQRGIVNMLLEREMAGPKYDFMAGKDGSIFRANETDGSINQVYGGKPDTFRVLSAQEKTSMGLPVDGAYQIGADNKISKIGGEGTTVNIDQKTEGAFDKKLAEKDAETYSAMSTEGMNAKAELGIIGELDGLLQGQGGTLTGLQGVLAQRGIDVGEATDDLQAAQALINKLVPTQRQPGSGSMSDRDVELFSRSLPSLWNQPGGNQKILSVMRGLAQYKAEQGRISDGVLTGEITRQEARKQLQALPNPLAEFQAAPTQPGGKSMKDMSDEELEAIINGG